MSAPAPEPGRDNTAGIFQPVRQRAAIRTLVVDDTPAVLEVICALLEMEDCVEIVGRATDGSEALEAVLSLRPDMVVMDVQMPNMDGLTAGELIHSEFPEVYIVLMSADPSYHKKACGSGADAFIDKLEFGLVFPRVVTQLTTAAQTRV